MTILDRILARKADEVADLERRRPLAEIRAEAAAQPPARGFARALVEGPAPRVIAEFKRASPSRGEIRPGADPAGIARAYAAAGAAALSVLTDRDFFHGSLKDLEAARAAVSLPVLRKDFTIAPIQIVEARASGADAILLIVAALEDAALRELLACAGETGLDALVEVHTRAELDRALACDATLIGVNNRDLATFHTDVNTTLELLPHAAGRPLISESGLADAATMRRLGEAGASGFLVGEALMREPDPGAALRRLRGET